MNDLHANMGNQLKLLNAKIILLETKVDKLQREVSFMHSQSVQETPPKGAFYPSVETDETRPSPVAASATLPQSTEEDFYKNLEKNGSHNTEPATMFCSKILHDQILYACRTYPYYVHCAL